MNKKEEKKRRLEDKIGPIETVIAPNTKFKGKIKGEDNIRIAGRFEGDVKCDQLVRIEKGGKLSGSIVSTYVIIEGELKGNIDSAEHVEIRIDGRVIGNINTSQIAIAEGSFIQGEIRMPEKENKPYSFVEKRDSGKKKVENEEESSSEG